MQATFPDTVLIIRCPFLQQGESIHRSHFYWSHYRCFTPLQIRAHERMPNFSRGPLLHLVPSCQAGQDKTIPYAPSVLYEPLGQRYPRSATSLLWCKVSLGAMHCTKPRSFLQSHSQFCPLQRAGLEAHKYFCTPGLCCSAGEKPVMLQTAAHSPAHRYLIVGVQWTGFTLYKFSKKLQERQKFHLKAQ